MGKVEGVKAAWKVLSEQHRLFHVYVTSPGSTTSASAEWSHPSTDVYVEVTPIEEQQAYIP